MSQRELAELAGELSRILGQVIAMAEKSPDDLRHMRMDAPMPVPAAPRNIHHRHLRLYQYGQIAALVE